MAFNIILVVLLLTCQHICYVMAADCTTAILASVFGTIGTLLVIAAIVALVWYCCRRRDSRSFSSTSSADTVSDPEFTFGTKTKDAGIGLNGSGTPVTFSHHYSEKAPSAAYNTSGVVNPAFGVGREVLIDMPPGNKGEIKIDLDGDPSIKPPAHNGDVKIDMDGGSGIKTPSGTEDVKLDMDLDHRHDVDFPDGNRPKMNLPDVDLSADRPSGRSVPGAEANVVIRGPSTPKFDEAERSLSLETVDAYLDRPGRGGFGLLIARDKTLPPPALFIREVTPGGIAAKTGLIDKGDKIIHINDTSIEGMPHDQAMALLRDDDRKILHLTLQKKALYKLKDRSYDPPGGSMEESCKIDMSPVLEAGVPSFDVDGMQGDAPDLGTMDISGGKTGVNISKPHVDLPEGKLNTNISGPHGFSDVDLNGPSSGLDLRSTKKKRGNCLSCASGGDKDEPYIKGKANSGLDLDRPDMETSGKVAMRGSGPNDSVPSTNTRGSFSGPSVDGKRFNFDSNGTDLDISARPQVQLDTNATDIEAPDVNLSTGKLKGPRGKLDAPTADLDLSSKRKKGGNCFSCAGGTDKDESYKKRKGSADFDFDGPDGSMEMETGGKFDISGSGPNIKGPDGEIKQEEFGLRASAPDVDLDVDKGRHMDISSPDITLPSSGTAAKVQGPSFDGNVEISDPNVDIKTRKPKVGVDANAPEINPSSVRPKIDVSSGKVKGPSVKVDSPSADINLPSSKKKRGNCLTCTGSGEKNEPYKKSRNNAGYDFEGPDADLDISTGRPKAGLSTDTPDLDAPKRRLSTEMSGPDVELTTGRMQGPKTHVDAPSAELDLPSGKKIGGSCFSCAGDGDKGEPYGARKGKAGFNMSGPEVDGSMEMKNVSRPSVDASVPDVDISTRRPKAGLSTDAPDIDAPEGGLSIDMSGPDAALSTGRMRGPRAQVDAPSAEVDLPSGKKKSGSCFSCAGDGDKGEPYGEMKGKAGFNLSGPEVDGSMKMKKTGKLDISGSGPEFEGRGKNKDLGFHATGPDLSGPDFDENGPKGSLSGPEFDLSGPKRGLSGPDFDVGGPKGGLSGPDFDVSGPRGGLSGPDFDVNGPKGGLSGPDVDVNGPKGGLSGPDFDVSGPKGGLSGPDFDVNGPKGGLFGPDVDVSGPKGGLSGPDFDVSGPKGGLSGLDFDVSGPRGGLSGPDFDVSGPKGGLSGPDVDVSGPKGGLSGPDFDVSGPKGGLSGPDFDVSGPRGGLSGPDFDVSGPKGGLSGPDVDVSGPKGGLSGPDFDASGPKGGLSGPDFDVRGPKGGFSGPDFDVSGPGKISGPDFDASKEKTKGPKVNLESPSAELGLPAGKKKGGNCLSCAGSADKDEPYRKTKGNAEFAFNGPEVDLEGPDADFKGLDGRNLDTPNVGGDVAISRPSASSDAGGRGPGLDIGTGNPSVGFDANSPSLKTPKGKLQTGASSPDATVSTGDVRGPKANFHGPSADGSLPSRKKTRGNCLSCAGSADKDEPYERPSGNAEFELDRPDIDGKFDLHAPSTNIKSPEFKVNTPDIDLASDKPKIGFKSPELDIPNVGGKGEIDKARPKGSGPSIGVGNKNIGIKGPGLDIDTPQGHGDWGLSKPDVPVAPSADFTGPDGKLDLDVNRPDLDIPAPKSRFEGKGLDMDTPEPEMPAGDFKLGGSMPDGKLDLDVNRPDLDISAPKSRFGGKGLDVDTPEPEMPAGDLKLGGSMLDGKLDLDVNRPDLDISAPKSRFGGKGFDMDTPEPEMPAGDFKFGGSMPDEKLDLDVNRPDVDILAPKSRFGGKGFDMDTPEPEMPAGDFKFGGSMPDEKLDLDVNRPDVDTSAPKSRFPGKGLDVDTPEPEMPTSDFNFGGSMPDGKLDLDVNRPDLDISAPKSRFGGKEFDMDTPEHDGKWSFQPGGKDYDANFDWGTNTSTPKANEPNKEITLLPHGGLELESEPLEGDISVANDYNFDLQSTPKTFPLVEYEEPRSLQRYDEIRPDMELRLLSPKQTDQSDPTFNFETPHSSLSMGKNSLEDRPGRMSLVKVEENVTICSASLEEDELPSPRNRTLTLDREIKQKIEVVFPGEEGSDTKQKGSTSSSSSSSSSDADAEKEKKAKRKKKSRLLKAFRKGSNSSASSKEDETSSKPIDQERKPSTSSSSSSSSDESPSLFNKKNLAKRKGSKSSSSSSDKEKRKDRKSAKKNPAPEVITVHPIKIPEPDNSLKVVTPDSPSLPRKSLKPKEEESSTSSSSSDDEIDKKWSVKQKGPKQRKSSTSSTSSADKDDSKNTKLPKSSTDADAPVQYNVEYTTIPKQFLVSEDTKEPGKPDSSTSTLVSYSVIPAGPELSYILEKPDDKTGLKGRKSSTSSSSDVEKPEYKISPEDPKPSMLYHVEYFTNQQQYIIEPHDDLDKPEMSIADVQEDAPEVTFHAVVPSDPKERKSSTSSSSSEESGHFSPKLDVTVHRYETVYHVPAPVYPSTDQLANVSAVEEHSVVVVSRSFKRKVSESDDQSEPQHPPTSTEIQFSEPPMDVSYHLEYPYNIRTATEDSNTHVQEDGIVPVVKSTSVEYEMPDLSILAKDEDRSSPTWDIKTYTFETVYHVNIPEKPATDANGFEIEEQSPVVVSRFINRISPTLTPGDDDLEEEVQLLTSTTDVQLSEPSNDFQLEYPEGGKFSITGEHHLPMTDEQWIVTHSVKKDKPDITAALALLDQPEETVQLKSNSSQDTDNKVKSPREKSPRQDTERRNSNSRLWELMQGYLIERPVMDDDGTEPESENTPGEKKEEDSKIESVKSEPNVERIVYHITHKAVQLEPVDVQVSDKEPIKRSITQVPKVESIVPKVAPVNPVTLQVDVGGKKPVVKEHHAAWQKQASLPLDVDDNNDDPWMRHYSKGLHQRGQHQPSTTKSFEKESSFAQSRSLSLSKVPHVKGVRTSSEQERERPRYSIESRTRTEPVPQQRQSTDRSQTGTSRQEPANRPSVSNLRSFWDK